MESGDNGTRREHAAAAAAFQEDNVESGGLLYITSTGRNDVLMGRGAPMIQYEGNVLFRDLVSTRKEEYMGNGHGTASGQVQDCRSSR
jgi:hypothetical protein